MLDRLGVSTTRSFQLFAALVEEQLANGVDLIAEATFHGASDREIVRGWGSRFDAEVVCVVCEAPVALRRSRLTTRDRHPSHAEADHLQIEQLGTERVDYARMPGRLVRVRTDVPITECVSTVVAELK